jgi:hypothetical protein
MQAEQILAGLRRHPRITFQKLIAGSGEAELLRQTLPFMVPFKDGAYAGLLPVLDWDHRLPSRAAVLRVYAFYSEPTMRAGEAEYQARLELIQGRDRFPEFDVPDFSGITADEAYEGDVDPNGNVQGLRLVSAWRRDIEPNDAHVSVQLARRSEEFRNLLSQVRRRPDYLGDLEAVCWTPPCESSYGGWTVDVWYLTDLSASVGKGRSFLVDLKANKVVGVREFVVRSG